MFASALLLAALGATPAAATADAGVASSPLRLRAIGDVMLGTTFPDGYLPPEDGTHSLDDVRDLLRDADVTFANLEGPLCDHGETRKCRPGAAPGTCYAFRSPTRYGQYLADAGVDVVSTANNHAGDFGDECRRETEATLDSLGIRWSGPPGSVATLERGGRRIGLVAFHASNATNDLNDLDAAAKLVRETKKAHDWVVVSFHGGAEGIGATRVVVGHEMFHGEDRGDLRAFAHAVVDAGADLVLGHGPHVVRGMETYRGRLIAYSMGNFATYGRFSLGGALADGMVLEVTLAADGHFVGGRVFPTHQEDKGIPHRDAEGRVLEELRTLTALDFPETGVGVSKDGELRARAPQ